MQKPNSKKLSGIVFVLNTAQHSNRFMVFQDAVINDFHHFLSSTAFPCVAAKDALIKDHIKIFVADDIRCPKDDKSILDFLYNFTRLYRNTGKGFYSAAIIFKQEEILTEELFDEYLWQRLQSISNMDALQFQNDKRVAPNPSDINFSFSIMEEAYFIVGLNPNSSRTARRFAYPTLVFNPHAQFENMKIDTRYEKMKTIVRKRDIEFSGSVNPMLTDFGEASEVYQYSGRKYDKNWTCPFIPKH